MVLLDDHGRVLGRINAIDLITVLVALALVPLVYVYSVRRHAPPPVVEAVIPAAIAQGQSDGRVAVRGRHLRPYLRANIGDLRAPFLFESPERAEVQVPPLAAGAYDLAFFDAWKEIARFPKAVWVDPGTPLDIRVRCPVRPEVLEHVKRARGEASGAATTPGGESSQPVLGSYAVTGDILDGVVRVRATWTADGWQANGAAIKAGARFILAAPTYQLEGEILSVGVPRGAR